MFVLCLVSSVIFAMTTTSGDATRLASVNTCSSRECRHSSISDDSFHALSTFFYAVAVVTHMACGQALHPSFQHRLSLHIMLCLSALGQHCPVFQLPIIVYTHFVNPPTRPEIFTNGFLKHSHMTWIHAGILGNIFVESYMYQRLCLRFVRL